MISQCNSKLQIFSLKLIGSTREWLQSWYSHLENETEFSEKVMVFYIKNEMFGLM
jgi:hypothetical protein